MLQKTFLCFFILFLSVFSNMLKIYDSVELEDSANEMSSVYTGPLVATGGAITDINKFIKEMKPTKIGYIESNKIILFDEPNEVFSFKTIKYYNVRKNNETFYIIQIDAQKEDKEQYEIIIELNEGPNYDRTLNIYKNNKPYILILWIENTRLIQKKNNKI
ncbi:MAG: hypothetical protein PHF86_07210 [Candidatus Nanoarchaeia archaeon]|jgi:hypothetical protein|nr:hypothetical protein [Candidatus Nanoarchaeia archaeon]